jgi:hypothetical protein
MFRYFFKLNPLSFDFAWMYVGNTPTTQAMTLSQLKCRDSGIDPSPSKNLYEEKGLQGNNARNKNNDEITQVFHRINNWL